MIKKLLLAILPSLLLLSACSSETDTMEIKNLNDNLTKTDSSILYEEVKNEYVGNIIRLSSELVSISNNSRSTTSTSSNNDIIGILINMSDNEIKFGLKKFDTEVIDATWEEIYLIYLDLLQEYCSESEITTILRFYKDYYSIGGHNIEYIDTKIMNMSPMAQNLILRAAAISDVILPVVNRTRVTGDPCLDDLRTNIMRTLISYDAASFLIMAVEATPGLDLVGACIAAGYDSYELLELARKYNLCRATRI